jgi:magnesium-transporting ATPase (P-type)
VEEGRHAWNNLQKAILYTLPTNAAQALLIMGAIILAVWVPLFATRFVLESVQILYINLLDSVLLTMPLMMEKKEEGLLEVPPREADAAIISPLFMQRVVVMGLAIALPGFAIYYHFGAPALNADGSYDALLLSQAQTAAFWAILFAHIGYVVSARSILRTAFGFSPFSNRWLLGGIAVSIVMHLVATWAPGAEYLFRTAPFPNEWWPLILLCFVPAFVAIELDKVLRRFAAAK